VIRRNRKGKERLR